MDILILVLGIAGLWIGTEFTVGGALDIARRHQLSEFFVGLVILSIGSDLPELAVAIDASIRGALVEDASGVVLGSSIGSLVAQIGFVMGVAGLIAHLALPRRSVLHNGAMLLGSTVLLFLFGWDGVVSRIEGLCLLTAYLVYVVLLFPREAEPETADEALISNHRFPWLYLVAGLAIITAASEMTVSSVISLAHQFGVSEALISVLFIGLGTSLPELSISIGAILKKRVNLSVGNLVGSNIFDTLVPIGAAALISPLLFDRGLLTFDLVYVFALSAVVLGLFLRRGGLGKSGAGIVLGLYLAYLAVKLSSL